eukprot:5685480-Pleurochrysis_carterae.AAC.1
MKLCCVVRHAGVCYEAAHYGAHSKQSTQWLHVAIGADISVEREGGRDEAAVEATFTCVGCKARWMHAPSMEGVAIAKSTVASLSCLSTSSMSRAAPKNSSGADTRNSLTVPAARSNAGLKSR